MSALVRPAVPLAAVLLLGGTAAAVAALNPAGPPPAHTGGFGEPTCVVCHTGDQENAYGGGVRIEGLPSAYVPDSTYLLTVLLRAEETAVAGFQLSARIAAGAAAGRPAGALRPVDARVSLTRGEDGQPYAHHTLEGIGVADPSGSSWAVAWMAPAGDAGTVVFHVAANSGNGDNSPLGDLVYTTGVSVGAHR